MRTTTLKFKAYLYPTILFFAPIIYWTIMVVKNTPGNQSFIILPFSLAWGNIVFILFSYHKEYRFDNQNLTIKHLITKKQTVIPLINITNLKLHEKMIRSGNYHNIIVETENRRYTLQGAYIDNMTQFFHELEKAVKRIS